MHFRRTMLRSLGATVACGTVLGASLGTSEPSMRWEPAHRSNFTDSNRDDSELRWIVLHTIEGSGEAGISTFQNPRSDVSSHFVVDRDGTITKMVRVEDIAWTNGNGPYNDTGINIEMAGYANETDFSEAMYEGVADLVAYLCDAYQIPKRHPAVDIAPCNAYDGAGGLIGHEQIPAPHDCNSVTGGKVDPGVTWSWDYLLEKVGGESDGGAAPAFKIGQNVSATAPINVRSSAEITNNVKHTQPTGTLGTVANGYVTEAGHTWWWVEWENDVGGWSAQEHLTKTDEKPESGDQDDRSDQRGRSDEEQDGDDDTGGGDGGRRDEETRDDDEEDRGGDGGADDDEERSDSDDEGRGDNDGADDVEKPEGGDDEERGGDDGTGGDEGGEDSDDEETDGDDDGEDDEERGDGDDEERGDDDGGSDGDGGSEDDEEGSQEPRFKIGQKVRTTARLRIRTDGTTDAEIETVVDNGSSGYIKDGYKTNDGFTWWKLSFDRVTGWCAGEFLRTANDEPDDGRDGGDGDARFAIGEQVRSTDRLRVRSEGSLSAEIETVVDTSSRGTTVDGYVTRDGYVWWKVDWGEAAGWSAQAFLESASDRDDPPEGDTLIEDVPYFNQHNNSLYPEGTCQNTVLTMLLTYYGWDGNPDMITREWDSDSAQTPEGGERVFNDVAAEAGLDVRASGYRRKRISDLRRYLDEGTPVMVYGWLTDTGHVVTVVGYDEEQFYVNDPAGHWNERYNGDFTSRDGEYVTYDRDAFVDAISPDGYVWMVVPE